MDDMIAVDAPPLTERVTSMPREPLSPADLLALPPAELTLPLVSLSLAPLSPAEVGSTCLALLSRIPEPDLVASIIDLGLSSLQVELDRVETELSKLLENRDIHSLSREEAAAAVAKLQPAEREALEPGKELEERKRRKETWEKIWPTRRKAATEEAPIPKTGDELRSSEGSVTGVELDDPWAESEEDGKGNRASTTSAEEVEVDEDPWAEAGSSSSRPSTSRSAKPSTLAAAEQAAHDTMDVEGELDEPSIDLPTFLSQPLRTSILFLASQGDIRAVRIIKERHPVLWPYRLLILDTFPAWVSASNLMEAGLLPAASTGGAEKQWPTVPPPHRLLCLVTDSQSVAYGPDIRPKAMLGSELTTWYTERVMRLDEYHMLDAQLAWVQHAASLGISGLDRIGEDLSLLSRLVYDADLSADQQDQWTLSYWQSATDEEIISAYLSNASSSTVASAMRRLVLPYLYVLESRAERAGTPDTQLVERMLHSRLLSLPLPLALPVFEASKATLPAGQRIIRNDLSVARLALAILYGSNEMGDWKTMSSIFECLPVWDVSGGDAIADREATNDTLDAIATFVRHAIASSAGSAPPSPEDLYLFFHPLPFTSLSRALDILDVHLESGEILARWSTPVQLRFLLQSARDKGEQLELADKLVSAQKGKGRESSAWERLWEDMKRLGGGDDAAAKGAFGMLDRDEMAEVWLGGVLRSGEFGTAKRMLRRLETEGGLSESTFERAVLHVSREFYDQAPTGNVHTGEMKLAFDCLGVVQPTAAIKKEKAFIEATSRLSTYGLTSPISKQPITPKEMKRYPNKLDLIASVLEVSPDAFRHPEIILDVAGKLGCGTIEDQIRIRAMTVNSCVKAGEYEAGYGHMGDMLADVKRLRSAKSTQSDVSTVTATVVWKACLQLGRVEGLETTKRLECVGRAVEYCPAAEITSVLDVWRKIETRRSEMVESAKRRRLEETKHPHAPSQLSPAAASGSGLGAGLGLSPFSATSAFSAPSFPSASAAGFAGLARLSETVHTMEDRVLGSRTAASAARAAKMAFDLGGKWRPSASTLAGRLREISTERSASRASGSGRSMSGESGDFAQGADTPASAGAEAAGDGWGFGSLSRTESRDSAASGGQSGERRGYGDLLGGLGRGEDERMRDVGRRALVKGVGWLLGADEREVS